MLAIQRMVRAKEKATSFIQQQHVKEKLRMIVLGKTIHEGLLFKLFIYAVLISVSTLYLLPVFYMVSTSLKSVPDLLDPTVKWLPRQLLWENYSLAVSGLKYMKALGNTLLITLSSAIFQMFSCALTGYALARLNIPGKQLLFAIALLTFLIPPQTLAIPLFVTYAKLGWLNTPLPFAIPAMLAQGIKGALFIIIFRQFFSSLPKELEESSKLDGAGAFRTFWKIMLPLARPALLIVLLFSIVWHWNDFFGPSLYLRNGEFVPLSLSMQYLQMNLDQYFQPQGIKQFDVNEPIKMAAVFLIILPPLLMYMFTQRYFVEGIERTGIVE